MTAEQPPRTSGTFFTENWVGLSLIGLMVVFIAIMFYLMTRPNQTARETALEAIILTAASTVASFLITKIYAEKSYNKSLRDHGVQIASGIMVLKRQMEGLTDWIGQKRATLAQPGSAEFSEAILEHVEQTLIGFKGMTETALGGIAGVIGDALAQYEAVMDQVSTVRLEAFQKTTKIQEELQVAASKEEVVKLQSQIEEIGLQTEKQIAKLARSSALPIPSFVTKRAFAARCPHCNKTSLVEMMDRQGETQVTACDFCGLPFNAHVTAAQKVITRPFAGWVDKGDIYGILVAHEWWVAPEEVSILIPAVITCDEKLRAEAAPSPFELQAMLIRDREILLLPDISNSTVRRFLGLLFHGRAFLFEPSQRITFKSVYVNRLEPDALLYAFVKACLIRIDSWKPLEVSDIPELHQVLLGGQTGREAIIRQALGFIKRHANKATA